MPRPSFIVILTDQQRGDCLGIDGHPVLLTPFMDSVAAQGVRFSRAYSTCPVCVPARRSLLTGQYPSRHGFFNNAGEAVEWSGPTLPGILSRAGYQTYWTGRSMHQHPPRKRYGFDHMVIFDHRIQTDYDEWLSRREPEGAGGYYGSGVMHNDWTARPWHMEESYHMTTWTVNEALRFLRTRDPSCPFFLVVSILAPHPPLNPPAFYMERYLRLNLPEPVIGDWAEPPPGAGRGASVDAGQVALDGEALRACRAGYYGLINHLDDQVRRLFSPFCGGVNLDEAVVIVTSDHGEMLGDHYLWRKSVPYEGSARIPLLVRVPAHWGLQSGALVNRPVGLEDIMPTVLEIAGLPPPDAVDGASLMPLLRGDDPIWRPWIHIEHAGPTSFHALTDGRDKFVWFAQDGREQFFDLSADPRECHDLAGDRAAAPRISPWRERLARELQDRPEGFSDGLRLIPGCPYPGVRKTVGEG